MCVSLFLTPPGLKHVSDDEKTHKNPGLRSQAPVHTGPKPYASPAPRPAASATPTRTLPPVLELDGKKWKVVSCWFSHTKGSPERLQQVQLSKMSLLNFY